MTGHLRHKIMNLILPLPVIQVLQGRTLQRDEGSETLLICFNAHEGYMHTTISPWAGCTRLKSLVKFIKPHDICAERVRKINLYEI